MSTFIPLPGAAADPAPQPVAASDGFFPSVDMVQLRATFRVDPTHSEARIRDAVLAAILDVARELADWRAVQVAAGFAKLEDVPNPTGPQKVGDDVAWSTALYLRAVSSLVAAELSDRTRDAGSTNAGHDRADELESVSDTHRRAYRWALSDLVGRRRSTIELI